MRYPMAGAALLLVLAMSACGGSSDGDDSDKAKASESESAEPEPTLLEQAYGQCDALEVGPGNSLSKRYMQIEDEGKTLIISGGDEYSTPPVGFCVLKAMDVPASVTSKVEGTTSMMGQLTDSWAEYEATWSYHPDNGLNMIIETIG